MLFVVIQLPMLLLDGKKLADRILDELKSSVAQMKRPPVLAIIAVAPNEATRIYIKSKKKAAERVGIELRIMRYPLPIRQSQIIQDIKQLNHDKSVDGIMVQLPLPKGLDKDKIMAAISTRKDIEKEPPTALGIMRLLDEYQISVENKRVVIIGAGCLVGQPLTKMMERKGAKVTTIGLVCKADGAQQLSRIYPKPIVACLPASARRWQAGRMSLVANSADILVSCCGCPKIITGEMVKPSAVVIDCGSPEPEIDFESVSKIASAVTPVPGGVGPMTVAMLMENLVRICYNKINAGN